MSKYTAALLAAPLLHSLPARCTNSIAQTSSMTDMMFFEGYRRGDGGGDYGEGSCFYRAAEECPRQVVRAPKAICL